jgi:hypothetical protein
MVWAVRDLTQEEIDAVTVVPEWKKMNQTGSQPNVIG